AMWLLALYETVAQEQGADPSALQGTTQNDIIKEYLSRGTYVFPPGPSLRLITDMVAYTVTAIPKWNPINICSYHLQEAGATPVQEIAYSLSTAIAVLDAVRESGQVPAERFADVVGRVSFFVNAGIRFVEEVCKLRAMSQMWDRITRERYGVTDERLRRFRYGVQVNSLGLTEAQPENNVQRIVLETLGVTLSRSARARAVQLPTWNEALGLPRPWDQQWSLRIQQVLAYETDLLEYDDIFDGSKVVEAKTDELASAAEAELEWVLGGGGAFAMISELKGALVASHAERTGRIESGDITVVGVNAFETTEPSPLQQAGADHVLVVDPAGEAALVGALGAWKDARDGEAVAGALDRLREAAGGSENLMEPSIALAEAGGTVGEWADALREVFGEYRAPTGVGEATRRDGSSRSMTEVRRKVGEMAASGGPPRLLLGKPGLDGHSNGAEQIAVAARDAGMEVIYPGIRLTPAQIAAAAADEDVDVVGLSILSGSHLELVPETMRLLREAGVAAPVVVGGIIPPADAERLKAAGVARVYTPKDFRLTEVVGQIAELALVARRDAGGTGTVESEKSGEQG
ncbi:MAG: methylmalonyl-CoA mutase family protein, partial [Acidimicrobiia bacterium]